MHEFTANPTCELGRPTLDCYTAGGAAGLVTLNQCMRSTGKISTEPPFVNVLRISSLTCFASIARLVAPHCKVTRLGKNFDSKPAKEACACGAHFCVSTNSHLQVFPRDRSTYGGFLVCWKRDTTLYVYILRQGFMAHVHSQTHQIALAVLGLLRVLYHAYFIPFPANGRYQRLR